MICLNCQNPTKRKTYKYCSNKCQADFQYKKFIENWKSGIINGNKGQPFPQLSNHLKRFLLEKSGENCCLYGWDKRHPVTKKVPLEVNHIDGNSLNNLEDNLQLLCPNCHSLTSNFRNLNKGNGRTHRRKLIIPTIWFYFVRLKNYPLIARANTRTPLKTRLFVKIGF